MEVLVQFEVLSLRPGDTKRGAYCEALCRRISERAFRDGLAPCHRVRIVGRSLVMELGVAVNAGMDERLARIMGGVRDVAWVEREALDRDLVAFAELQRIHDEAKGANNGGG